MTPLLLDTHVVLWWLSDDERVGHVRERVMTAPSVHVSAASTWEIAIKQVIGKLQLELNRGESFPGVCAAQGFVLAEVSHEDAWAVRELPPSRADPFDRLIAAAARRRGWTVVTSDPGFDSLGVATLRP